MKNILPATLIATLAAATLLSAAPKFTSVWRSSDAGSVSFAGKKIAALVISHDDSLRIPGEEALAKELIARGLQSVATYRIAPKEEMQSADRARPWFEKSQRRGGRGDAARRQGNAHDLQLGHVGQSLLQQFLGLLRLRLGHHLHTGSAGRDTVVTVETTIYSLPRDQLLWAAVSETRDSKSLPGFVQELVKASVKELQKQGLAKNISK